MTYELTDQQRQARERIQRAYQEFMATPQAEIIMEDLGYFCCANRPTFEPDDPHGRVSAFREGRREVYLRIQRMSQLLTDNTTQAPKE